MRRKLVIGITILVALSVLGYLYYLYTLRADINNEIEHAQTLIDEGMAASDTILKQYGSILSDPWHKKFAPIIADTTKQEFAAGYVTTKYAIRDVVSYIDKTLALLSANDRQKNTELVNQIMIADKRAAELNFIIGDALFQIEFLEFWSEQDKEHLKRTIPLSLEYAKNDAQQQDKVSWEAYHFQDVPLIVANTLLNKFRKDALITQDVVLELIYAKAVEQPINQ